MKRHSSSTPSISRRLRPVLVAIVFLSSLVAALSWSGTAVASPPHGHDGQPDFGPNVKVFDPSMPLADIQAAVDAVKDKQLDNEMGTDRYALLFKPGTYGTVDKPLIIQVGYYTEVAGLGLNPTDVTINGHVDVYNRCLTPDNCIALDNFWRSVSNLTINVAGLSDCRSSGDFWAVSQAAPMRRVNVVGNLTLMDYCTGGPQYASGGFIADSKTGTITNGSQQQFYVRNSTIGKWSNGVWNQVFSGVVGAPAECFPAAATCGGNPYTTLATTPASREKPYLYMDSHGSYNVFVPSATTKSSDASWANGATPGRSIPLSKFFVVKHGDSVREINQQLDRGMNLLLTPGVYDVAQTISIHRSDTVVLGLGMATLTAVNGAVVIDVSNAQGVDLAGITVDAGVKNSPVLVRIGDEHGRHSDPRNPTALQDVFFRIGGPHVGKATVSLEVNADNVILDDIWSWRADHGVDGSVGWTTNTARNGVIVNGDNVTATGFFVEHYQQNNVIWNGNGGKVVFFQNELAYDVPSQAAWMEAPGVNGWAAFKVGNRVRTFNGDGMGSYSFFNQGVDIFAANAFEVPKTLAPGSLHNLLTIFLNGKGGIQNVVNGIGGSATAANPSTPVTVVNYPAV